MTESEIPDLITDKTIVFVFLAVIISGGTSPGFELLGYTHPILGIFGALVGAFIAVYEARNVQQRIDEAKQLALLGEGFAPGLSG